MFRRLLDIFRRSRSIGAENTDYIPDPFKYLPHKGNQELFAAMRPFYSPEQQFGSYNAHPDMEVRLDELAPPKEIIRTGVYGFPVMANAEGLVFAWAKGRWTIMIKLGEEHREGARKDCGRVNTEYGKGWIEFPAYYASIGPEAVPGPEELKARKSEGSKRLQHWIQVAYDEIGNYIK
ncbi:MAG TPA: hypothetical protein VFF39_03460 [Verrucomicrobiae bacterium]|nr:hypothetical protein [Verrucomicrobiae bacterium]